MRQTRLLVLTVLAVLLVSCSRETEPDLSMYSTTQWTEYKVAVIAPLSESSEYTERLERISDWFTKNFHNGQKLLDKGVSLKLEWFDEASMTEKQLQQLGRTLAMRNDLAAVVGPFYSSSVDAVASKLYSAGIPMFVPVTTSEDVQRRYSVSTTGKIKSPFMWCLSESDLAQTQVLMGMIASFNYDMYNPGNKPSLSIVSSDNMYGKTFNEWGPYYAVETGIDLRENLQYTEGHKQSMVGVMSQVIGSGADNLICVPASADDALELLRKGRTYGNDMPNFYFTDCAFNASLLSDSIAESAQGVSMYADPSSGFSIAYQALFGTMPTPDECMFYDALLLAGMTCHLSMLSGETDLNALMDSISNSEDETDMIAWDSHGIQMYIEHYRDYGQPMILKGATGALQFDRVCRTSRLTSTYANWRVYDGKFVIMSCFSSGGEGLGVRWRLAANDRNMQTFNENVAIPYAQLKDRWAVLVCSSKDWKNYRHSADVLGMYQLLKRCGYKDDRIILIWTDNISDNPNNIYRNEIRSYPDGNNLLKDVCVDYGQDSISAQDICDILAGHKSAHLPVVLETDSTSNVFLYWSGHGEIGYFLWDSNSHFTANMLQNTVSEMANDKRFRKFLICTEPCHSSSVLETIETIPGVLGIASSYASETSFADAYDAEMNIWMSDRFSNNLISYGWKNGSFDDLYRELWSHTIGSHVKVFNADYFGNLEKEYPYTEFF